MGEHTAFVIVMFLKAAMVVSAIAGTVFLAYNDKPGWGWLIFIAVMLSTISIRIGNDEKPSAPRRDETAIRKQT